MNRNSLSSGVPAHRPATDNVSRSHLRPKRELMVHLGWLRLLQAITAKRIRDGDGG